MNKEAFTNSIDLMSDKDRKAFCDASFKSIPEVKAEPWEIKAIEDGQKNRLRYGAIAHEDINWK